MIFHDDWQQKSLIGNRPCISQTTAKGPYRMKNEGNGNIIYILLDINEVLIASE